MRVSHERRRSLEATERIDHCLWVIRGFSTSAFRIRIDSDDEIAAAASTASGTENRCVVIFCV